MTTQTKVDGDTLTVEQVFDAPQADVFDAWIDAAKTTHWCGCANTTRVQSTIDPKAGGPYQHLMKVDGVGEYLIDGTILECRRPDVLSYKMPSEGDLPEMVVRVTFEATGDQTKVTLIQSPLPGFLHDVVAAGWTASFGRLSEFFSGARRAA